MPDGIEKPIEVSGSTVPTTLAAAARYALSLALTFAVARGWVDAGNVEGYLAMAVTVLTVGYGLFKTYQNRRKLIVTADAAPNSVARVTS